MEIGGVEIAIRAARNFRILRRRGITVRKTIFAIITTRCIESGYELLRSDRDFDPFAAYLAHTWGEINDSQQAAWRETPARFWVRQDSRARKR